STLGLAAALLFANPVEAKPIAASNFIRHPAFKNVTISPNGKYLAVVSAIKDSDKYQLVILPTASVVKHKPKVTARFGLTDYEIFMGVMWVNNERLIAATGTQHG